MCRKDGVADQEGIACWECRLGLQTANREKSTLPAGVADLCCMFVFCCRPWWTSGRALHCAMTWRQSPSEDTPAS